MSCSHIKLQIIAATGWGRETGLSFTIRQQVPVRDHLPGQVQVPGRRQGSEETGGLLPPRTQPVSSLQTRCRRLQGLLGRPASASSVPGVPAEQDEVPAFTENFLLVEEKGNKQNNQERMSGVISEAG